jgi:hypothetical protein
MENSKPPKIFITDGYKSEHKKFVDKLIFNSILPVTSEPYYIFHDPSVAERITEEAMFIQNSVIKSIADNLILVVGAGKTQNFFSNIFEKKLDLSNIIVSLQSNNQKD